MLGFFLSLVYKINTIVWKISISYWTDVYFYTIVLLFCISYGGVLFFSFSNCMNESLCVNIIECDFIKQNKVTFENIIRIIKSVE